MRRILLDSGWKLVLRKLIRFFDRSSPSHCRKFCDCRVIGSSSTYHQLHLLRKIRRGEPIDPDDKFVTEVRNIYDCKNQEGRACRECR